MVNIKPKARIVMKMEGTGTSHARTDIDVRGIPVVIDEPEERGGTNKGPSPTETLMTALIGCTNVITNKVAHKHGIEISDMHVAIEATFDRRGVLLEKEIDVPFPALNLIIDVTTDASEDDFAKVKEDLPKFCVISKVIEQSGTDITTIWNVTRP